eukprot:CAMPEP_0202957184 /NCGR_PEP_ID=MMETSP1396-20130829/1620_1 /ASSEMBLY_ACC=CAM_ASM_000872 /TAXON_ID= /ORGANISM="Pseudokeronopsis sp., Strain Brazil" /LENGTH=65 /DNA_ID=CAMNT_0049674543 /DNA_START=26 /DNA_END=223 /DNA_ORIENTATION=-
MNLSDDQPGHFGRGRTNPQSNFGNSSLLEADPLMESHMNDAAQEEDVELNVSSLFTGNEEHQAQA